ncbi:MULTISPECIES: GAF domain-containing protein [Saccharopolyspora]|uniref:GAF domain-containing protein n=1 Tax=Saccharopolyspora elongata TaxID=2530387 RepID=A0A4R4YUC1_9PSEU|nr:GAF domain-containing protein [Saccharopolyspora elongata]TDD48968.1 GAF domain-containing protein [Saccharopolyspora elongata]
MNTYDPQGTTTFDDQGNRMLEPQESDKVVRLRVARLRELGLLGLQRDEQLSGFAAKMTETFQAAVAVVNIFDATNQNFVGAHMQAGGDASSLTGMPKNVGWCPHTLARKKAFPLGNVMAYPRFAGNVLVDEMGAKSYLGAPLIDDTGTALGTVCVVDIVERDWNMSDVNAIKTFAKDVVQGIYHRQGRIALP